MKSDTTEKGLESLIAAGLAQRGRREGSPSDYDREYAVDLAQLAVFLLATQPGSPKPSTSPLPARRDRSSSPAFRARSAGAACWTSCAAA